MATDKRDAFATARRSQIFGWISFLALLGLAARQYVWGDFALLTAAVWIGYYYTRFTTPPEDVADARNGVVILGLFLFGVLMSDVMQRDTRIEFISDLKSLCTDVEGSGERQWEKCDELRSLIESADDNDYDDWVSGT